MKKQVSRQYLWQLKRKKIGKCIICGDKLKTKNHCEFHAKKHNFFSVKNKMKKKMGIA